MDLSEHQRKLLGIIKSTYEGSGDEDPYIRNVARSTNLKLIREIAAWWRELHVERYCILTASLLKNWGMFESTVEEFAKTQDPSRFIERLGPQFLEVMGHHENPLISSVARFELALIRVRRGDPGKYSVDWQCDPAVVLDKLLRRVPLSEANDGSYYRTIVSNELPGLFRILKSEAQ